LFCENFTKIFSRLLGKISVKNQRKRIFIIGGAEFFGILEGSFAQKWKKQAKNRKNHNKIPFQLEK